MIAATMGEQALALDYTAGQTLAASFDELAERLELSTS